MWLSLVENMDEKIEDTAVTGTMTIPLKPMITRTTISKGIMILLPNAFTAFIMAVTMLFSCVGNRSSGFLSSGVPCSFQALILDKASCR